MVLVLAIVSLVSLPSMGDGQTGASRGDMPIALLMPYLAIITAISTGFRVTGDIIALLVGVPATALFALLGFLSALGGTGMQGPDGGALAFAFGQTMMVLLAATDLINSRKLSFQPINAAHRLIGLVVPIVAFLFTASLTRTSVREHQDRMRSLAVDREIQARNDAQRWVDDSQLDDLLKVARCIEATRGDTIAGPPPATLLQTYSRSPYCGREFFETRRYTQTHNPADSLDTIPHPRVGDKHHLLYYEPPKINRVDPFHSARFTLGVEAIWNSTEWPHAAGHPGTRNFLIDPYGKIHVTGEHRRATIADPLVPPCDTAKHERPDQKECAPTFQPRQRWGLIERVPWVRINSVYNADVAWPATAAIEFGQVNALDSVRYVSIDWGDGQPPNVVNVRPAGSMIWVERARDGSIIRVHDPEIPQLHHQYRKPGPVTVRVTVVTRSGEKFTDERTANVTGASHR